MNRTGRPERVDVYFRRRGARGERYRFLLTESTTPEIDALAYALELVQYLGREFPEYEYLLVIVRRAQSNGWEEAT